MKVSRLTANLHLQDSDDHPEIHVLGRYGSKQELTHVLSFGDTVSIFMSTEQALELHRVMGLYRFDNSQGMMSQAAANVANGAIPRDELPQKFPKWAD